MSKAKSNARNKARCNSKATCHARVNNARNIENK